MSLVPNNGKESSFYNENNIEFISIKQEVPEHNEYDVRIKIEPEEHVDESNDAENSCHNSLSVNPAAICSAELTIREEPLDYSVNNDTVSKHDDESYEEKSRKSETTKKSGKNTTPKNFLPNDESEENMCMYCKKTFTFPGNLKKHIDKKFCKVLSPITCTICFKNFESIYLLKSHLRRHNDDKPFTCDLCQTRFKQKCALVLHMKIHNGVTPHKCQYCNKSFTHKTLLKAHVRIHTGERPFQCPLCPKSFTHKHNMQRHMNNHKKVKKLTCDVCNKKFPRESRLKYHMKVHISEKHFPCFVCPRKFSNRQNVLRHYTKKHPDATYDCKETDASIAAKVWDELESKVRQIDRFPEKIKPIPIANAEILETVPITYEKSVDSKELGSGKNTEIVKIKVEPVFEDNTDSVTIKVEPIVRENTEEESEYILPE